MKKPKSTTLRTLSALGVIALVCLGLAIHTGTGTPSSWGIYDVAALCPLGVVEVAIASKTFVPPLLIGLLIVAILVLLFGRAFCAWGCPVPLLRRVFGFKDPAEAKTKKEEKRKKKLLDKESQSKESQSKELPKKLRGSVHDSRNWVLGGTILTTAVFGFPVFCIICPVGLTFASLIVVWRLFEFGETTWSLLVFPALLILEIVFLKKWCHRFCPLGALLSLMSRANRSFRPHSDKSVCLREKGEGCHTCAQVCPEGIDVSNPSDAAPLNECTKCRVCAEKCPVEAITFPFLPKKKKSEDKESEKVTLGE